LSAKQREILVANGTDIRELTPFTVPERADFLNRFVARAGKAAELPEKRQSINLSNLIFDRPVSFSHYIFPSSCVCVGSKFCSLSDFSGAIFWEHFDCSKASFMAWANFLDAKLNGVGSFWAASFSQSNFRRISISGDAYFHEANFVRADFHEAQFKRKAVFTGTRFSGFADFGEVVFSKEADFRNAEFDGYPDFRASEFNELTRFVRAKFKAFVPDFRDAKLREATEWHDAEWPTLPKNCETARDQISAYERLKAEMERLKKHEDEQFFFAKELRIRRTLLHFKGSGKNRGIWERLGIWWFQWLPNFAYDFLSGYGLNIGRPLLVLLSIFVLCAVIFTLIPDTNSRQLEPTTAAALSATNLIGLLPFKPEKEVIEHLSVPTRIISDIQSVLGVVLLFLFGLGLRNRFRMR